MNLQKLFIPTTTRDLVRRGLLRIGACSIPYLGMAWAWSACRDDRLFHGFWFWWCVVLVPALGFAVDGWRLRQTATRARPAA